jgi:hypothetical protein
VIPAMDHIDMVFTNACLPTSKFNPAVRAAIKIAKKTLNRYYSLTDASELFRITMGKLSISPRVAIIISFVYQVLHPRYKLGYFKAAGWTQEWIDTAEDLVRNQFDLKYTSQYSDDDDAGKDKQSNTTMVVVCCGYCSVAKYPSDMLHHTAGSTLKKYI